MKSIIQESSSVAKAIEQAWTAAGKPQEFTVKVFEEAQKNFFGLTTKSAKIALLFGTPVQRERDARSQSSYEARKRTADTGSYAQKREERRTPAPQQQRRQTQETAEKREMRSDSAYPGSQARQATSDRSQRPERVERAEYQPQQRPERPAVQQEARTHEASTAPETPKQPREIWTAELVQAASAWVRGVLDEMEKKSAQFTTQTNNYYLRVMIDTQLAPTPEQERTILRNMSFLLLQALKKQFKRPLHGFKIVLVRE